MTREEATNILENNIVDGHVEGTPTFMDAFWMAVDALKQLSSYEQTINKLTDAISEQALKQDSVLDDIKADLWMEGMNMAGEYQGVWVRFRDIEKVIDKHIGKEKP